MNDPAVESQAWPRRRWWGVVLGLFALQIGLLCWFGARGPVKRRPVSPSPQLKLAGAAAGGGLAFNDTTLFVQGHPRSFSGAGWMKIPVPEYQPPEWSEPARWLALDAQQLGAGLRRFVQTNQPFAFVFTAKPEAEVSVPEIAAAVPATAQPSALRLEGALRSRRLLSPPVLKGQEHGDLLANSIVQVLVNGDGDVIAPPVLLVSSGKKEADDDALAVAQAAQFEPLPRIGGTAAATNVVLGTLVFEWKTLPMSETNTPAASP